MTKATEVTEAERSAVEAELLKKFDLEYPITEGAAGNSPYSPVDVIYGPETVRERGTRVALTPVCESHNGAGKYKGRGRWRTVWLVVPKQDGDHCVCDPSDRDAEAIGASGFYVRPWATHEAEEASRGLGLGAGALADALARVGL